MSFTAHGFQPAGLNCIVCYINEYVRDSQEVPRILWYGWFGAPWVTTGQLYVPSLARLYDAIWRKQHHKWQGQRFLHYDDTLSHTSLVLQQFLPEKFIPVIIKPPYFVDLALSDLSVTYSEKLASWWHALQPWRTLNWMRQLNSGRFQKKTFSGASNKAGSMEQVCARARVQLWRLLGKGCLMYYDYIAIAPFWEHFDCPLYM